MGTTLVWPAACCCPRALKSWPSPYCCGTLESLPNPLQTAALGNMGQLVSCWQGMLVSHPKYWRATLALCGDMGEGQWESWLMPAVEKVL